MLSIVLPAKNEAAALTDVLPALRKAQPEAEIIVVDDGSTDDTMAIVAEFASHTSIRREPSNGDMRPTTGLVPMAWLRSDLGSSRTASSPP